MSKQDPDIVLDLMESNLIHRNPMEPWWPVQEMLPAIKELMAEAWEEGRRIGTSRAMRHMSDEPNLPLSAPTDNPYLENTT